MTNRTKNLIIIVAGLQLVLILLVAATPTIVENWIPGQYWSYLPDWVIASMGERDDYLPALGGTETAAVEVDAASLLPPAEDVVPATSVPSPTPTSASTATAVPTEVVESAASAETEAAPTAEPSPTPTTEPSPTPIPPTPTPEPLPTSFRISGLENEAQKFNNCGPTNLSIVLRFYDNNIDQLEVASYLKPNSQDRNVSPWQISDYVNEQTALRSITRSNGDQELLKRLITAGFPVVIEKGYDPDVQNARGWYGHYLTMFGYDDEAEMYNTMDTFLGPFTERETEEGQTLEEGRLYSYEYVDYYWQQFNYTYYVVYRPDQEEALFSILGEDTLDDIAMWEATAQRAQAEIEEDAEDQFAWFNLGTALTRLGEQTGEADYYENGAVAFDRALGIGMPSRMLWYQHRPYIAYMKIGRYQDMLDLADATLVDPGGRNVEETYYYKGHALSFLGDLDGAAAAFRRSLELNEFFYPAEFALDYVNSIR